MEFFRKNQRLIIGIIAVTFIAWTVGLMLLPALVK
jgi:cytochrome c-type biogenesis protein CcmE